MEKWKQARAMIKAGNTILKENYEQVWGIGCVCEELKEVIETMESWDNKCKLNYPSDCPAKLDGNTSCDGCEHLKED